MEERDGPRTYGLRDMGGGVLGMEFPDFDAEAEQKQTESVQEEEQRLREEMRAAVRLAQRGEEEKDPADVLWEDPSTLREPGADLKRYLRPSDLHRVQLLDAVLAANPSPDNAVLLTPDIELLQVAGDAVANEYVLYDKKSKVLACRELFHGAYSDLDPVNTWFCRVWFKFMKKGNYKRTDIIPRSKYWQLMRQDGLQTTQRWVDWLTRNREIHSLVFAHGTPPATGDCVNTLREQWGLPALQRLPHAEEIRKMEEPEVAPKPNKKKPTEVKRKEKPDLSWLYKSSS
ncbi:hypothetical protein AGDE_14803 [Angomonas deanei]|uniref:Uncharacterized protein n=1 Tax=Angomonas deanei TaxID=59799 RepID=A0A7G2CN06_9TRYP|nr:hypothetical protein AGDE_14803 [Angomonas deanei]CAD2221230.1 hypothetical protein, conserved [Angomonas deanei]|eukprot:EPY20196.1 hypothetical protein AGDE_14803 [Angomonas deanei]